jgi:hypothetical protein
MESEPPDCRTKQYGGMLFSQISSDAIAHRMIPAIAETHKMVPVKTVIDAVLHVSFPIHYQIDASMHKVVPVAGIVAQKWYRLWYQQKITQKIVVQFSV